MTRGNREYIYARATLALASAAQCLGIALDLDALAPTLAQGGYALIPAEQHLAVARAIFQDRRETLGIDIARALPLELAGLWGFLLRSSNTFGDMLRRAERYMRVVNRYSEFVLEERANRLAMVCPHPDPSPYGPREQIVYAFLGHWIAWGRQLTRVSFAVEVARFRWSSPRARKPVEQFFGGRVEFGAKEDALLIDSGVLSLPLPERTPEAVEQFEAYAAALIRRMTSNSTVVERVREAIGEALLTGSAKEAVVAQRLAMTVRTMHRHLAQTGTSFRKMRDELLRQRAEALLREHRVPIGEVSYLLGYAEPSNFHRAFRRWTGLTPAQWREQM
ncbi:MAG TPA: AraC family transcriptional regulator ligand-binding domain-containing protein [Burkholderiales bacterium]|nr:AraC family transcriptional regulator ligand-binding domain-containing protein [Burkholderiales bacterium]